MPNSNQGWAEKGSNSTENNLRIDKEGLESRSFCQENSPQHEETAYEIREKFAQLYICLQSMSRIQVTQSIDPWINQTVGFFSL